MRTIGDFLMGDELGMAPPHPLLRRRLGLPERDDSYADFVSCFVYSMYLRAFRTSQPEPVFAELVRWVGKAEHVEAGLAELQGLGWLKDIAAEERKLVFRHIDEKRTCAYCPWCSGDLSNVRETPGGPRCGDCLGLAITTWETPAQRRRLGRASKVPPERWAR